MVGFVTEIAERNAAAKMASVQQSPPPQAPKPMFLKTASLNPKSPAYFSVNPNDDEAERRRNREHREAAQRRLLETPSRALQPLANNTNANGMSKERVLALYQNCIPIPGM